MKVWGNWFPWRQHYGLEGSKWQPLIWSQRNHSVWLDLFGMFSENRRPDMRQRGDGELRPMLFQSWHWPYPVQTGTTSPSCYKINLVLWVPVQADLSKNAVLLSCASAHMPSKVGRGTQVNTVLVVLWNLKELSRKSSNTVTIITSFMSLRIFWWTRWIQTRRLSAHKQKFMMVVEVEELLRSFSVNATHGCFALQVSQIDNITPPKSHAYTFFPSCLWLSILHRKKTDLSWNLLADWVSPSRKHKGSYQIGNLANCNAMVLSSML